MYLNQIEIHDKKKLSKLNNYLSENFKIRVDVDGDSKELLSLREHVINEIHELKVVRGCTPKDADLGKSLAMLEAIDLILANRRAVVESSERFGPYSGIVDKMSDAVAKYVNQGDDLDSAISVAMREYRSSKYRYPDHEVEQDVRHSVASKLIGGVNDVDETLVKGLGVEVDEAGDFYHPNTDHGSLDRKPRRSAAQDVPTAYTQRGQKAAFGPRDSGRETTPARSKLNMSEDGGQYIYLADEPKLAFNPNTSKGNAIAMTGFDSGGEEISYPVRVRFVYDDAAGLVNIITIVDGDGSETGTELDDAEKATLGQNILDELMAKGIY